MKFGNTQRNFSYVLGGGIGATGLNASFYFIFAAILSPEDYGHLSYIIAIAGTASIISQFGFPHSITVYQSKGKSILSNQVNMLAVITSTLAALILLTISLHVALLSFSLSFFIMNQHNLLGFKKYKKFFWLGILKGILVVTLPILFYFIFDIPGVLLGMALSNILCSIPFFKILNFKIRSFNLIKPNFKFLLHNFSVQSSSGFAKFLDKLIIVPIFGFAYLGLYQFNLQILIALTILPAALHSFLLTEEASGNKHPKINFLIICFAILIVIISIFVSPILIDYIFPKYYEGIQSLQIMLVSLIPISISAIINPKLQAKESTKVGFPPIIRIGSLIAFIVIFSNYYGLIGLAMAVLLSSIFEAISLSIIFYSVKDNK